MLDLIKCIEKLGSGVQLADEELSRLTNEEKELLDSKNLSEIKSLLNAPKNIVCGVFPADDDDDKDEEDDKQDTPDKEEKSA